MVVVSGQVRRETIVPAGSGLRQLGDQEAEIVRIVEPLTKYAVQVQDPARIRYHLERAIHLARSGRPGPTWVDIPMDIQGAMVDEGDLAAYDPEEDALALPDPDAVAPAAAAVLERIRRARRPVILVGTGVRLAGAVDRFRRVVERLGIPVATSFSAQDLLPDDHPCLVGRQGSIGDRAGNFAVQNADLVLILGARMNIRQLSYNWGSFAREAFKIMVDIDAAELAKPTLTPDLPILADLRTFLEAMERILPGEATTAHAGYLAWCQERRRRYPVVLPEYWERPAPVNPYCLVEAVYEALDPGDVVVTGDGTACIATFQAARIKEGQRLYSNSGCASMGYDLPAAIGAAWGAQGRRVICMAGDGSMMMNLQELATIAHHRLPVKIILFNNGGYHSIRQTQSAYFPDNEVGCGPGSGVGFPDFQALAASFGIPSSRLGSHGELRAGIPAALAGPGPFLCEVILDPEQPFAPKLSSRRLEDGRMVTSPLEDMAPFLGREELAENLLVAPWVS
jgi:acetolactate synthase-1/2/3 large subunit